MESFGYATWDLIVKYLPWAIDISPHRENNKLVKKEMLRQKIKFCEGDDNYKVKNSFQFN